MYITAEKGQRGTLQPQRIIHS